MCDEKIMEIIDGNPVYPLGNYRLIIFTSKSSGQFEAPVCVTCHDAFSEKSIKEFQSKFSDYLMKVYPLKSAVPEISSFTKRGALNSMDLENGVRVWQ